MDTFNETLINLPSYTNIPEEENWTDLITQYDFNVDFACEVIMMVESKGPAFYAVDAFTSSIKDAQEFKPFSTEDLKTLLSKPPDNVARTYVYSLYEKIRDHFSLRINDELTTEEKAYIIKLRIMLYREEYMYNRKYAGMLKNIMNEEIEMMRKVNAELEPPVPKKSSKKGKKSGKSDKSSKAKKSDKSEKSDKASKKSDKASKKSGKSSKGKGSKGKKTPEPPPPVKKTVSELHRDIISRLTYNKRQSLKQTLSLGDNGFYQLQKESFIYFILYRMYDKDLITALAKINVYVSCLLEISSGNQFTRNDSFPYCNTCSEHDKELKGATYDFWLQWNKKYFQLNSVLPEKTFYLKYYANEPEEIVVEDMKKICYNIADFKREYSNYLQNVLYFDIKPKTPRIALKCLKTYNRMLHAIPNECISIPIILSCLLEETCQRTDPRYTPSDLKLKLYQCTSHACADTKMEELIREYENPTHVKQFVNPDPIMINYGNIVKYQYYNLPYEQELYDCVFDMLKTLQPIRKLYDIDRRPTSQSDMFRYHYYKWSKYMYNISSSSLKFCIYSYMFTRGGLYNIAQKTDVDQETMNKNLKNFMFNPLKSYNNTDCSAQVEVYTPKVVTISDYNWAATSCQEISDEPCTIAERFDTISMVQMLQRVYDDFDHFDYKYFRPDDSILIRFHDNTDEFGVAMDSNEMIIPTLLCFRDFCTYLLPKCTKWFMEQERIYWEHEKEYDIYEDPNYVVNEYERTVYDPDNFDIEQYSVFDEFIQKMEDEANKYKKAKKDKKGGKKGKKDSAKSKKGDDKEKKGDKKTKKGDDKEKKEDKKSKKGDDKKSKKSDDKDKKGKKGKKKGKEEPAPCKFPLPEIPDKPRQRFISTSIPNYLDREANRHYEFEAYDLGPNPIFYKYKTIEFKSVDGIRVLINKNQFTHGKSNYILKLSSHDHNVIFNMKLEECLVPSHPFAFHLNLPNGINMAFGPYIVRLVKKKTILNAVDSWLSVKKRLEKRRRAKSEANLRKLKSMLGEVEMEFVEEGEEEETKVKSVASNPPKPDFRVISSPLHKFLYIKRVKSDIVLSENPDEKIIRYKPKLFIRKWKKKDRYVRKLFDRPNIHYDGELDWHATLPNGLSIEITPTVEASKAYVKQKYVANKPQVYDMKEHSRCYLSNGIVKKNMKDGSCVYYKPEMTITRIPYFKRKPKSSSFVVLPYYACVKDLTTFQVFIKRLCHKYQKKMVDIDINYRKFKQSRSRRRMRRIYSLCENVHLRGGKYNPIDDFEVTTRTGNYYTIQNDKLLFVQRYSSSANYNYISKNSIIRREDGTTWRLTKNGKSTTQYPDNTRITTWLTVINENFHVPKTTEFNHSSDDNDFFCYNYSGESLRGCDRTGRTKLGSAEEEGYEEYYKSIHNEIANEYSSFHFQPEDEYIGFEDFEPYVLIGLSYKFEHPCFAPVEYDYKDVITVTLPDEIKVIYTEPRNFLIESVNRVVMEISKNRVEYCAESCQMCNSKTFCYWDIKPYMFDERIEKDHIFFYMKDSEGKNFEVNFDGNIRKYIEYDEDYCPLKCCKIHKKKAQERLFVLQRDLTGIELSKPPANYRFIDCLLNLDKKYLIDRKEDVTILTKHLYKTYSEHLMSIYPIPVLLLECEADRIGRLWTLGDLALYPTLKTRSPIFYIQRIILDLPMEEIFDLLKQAVNNMSITTGHQKFGVKKTRGKPPIIPKPKEKRPKVIFHFECTELQYPCYWDVMPNLCSRLVYVCFNKAVDVVDQRLKKIEEYERSLIEAKEGECLCGGVDLVCARKIQ